MGIDYLDEYSLSHFIAGIILHRMNIPRLLSYGLHLFFEIFENYIYVPYFGGRCIRIEYLLPIMDCKTIPDTTKNIIVITRAIPKGNIYGNFSVFFRNCYYFVMY